MVYLKEHLSRVSDLFDHSGPALEGERGFQAVGISPNPPKYSETVHQLAGETPDSGQGGTPWGALGRPGTPWHAQAEAPTQQVSLACNLSTALLHFGRTSGFPPWLAMRRPMPTHGLCASLAQGRRWSPLAQSCSVVPSEFAATSLCQIATRVHFQMLKENP